MILQKFMTLLLLSASVLTNSYGQAKAGNKVALSQIRKTFRQINGYKNYEVVTIDDSEDFLGQATDNGGYLKGYFKGDSLKKIIEWVGLSNKVLQNEYYFDNGRLVFVYATESRYRFNVSAERFDYSKPDKVFAGRYYFNDDKLIASVMNDKEREKTKDAAGFLASGWSYLKLLSKQRK